MGVLSTMRIIFEDDNDSVLKNVIEHIYGDENDIIFSCGSSKIIKYVTDDTLVYYDLVPDNPSTAIWYRRIDALTRKYNNSMIIPVVCSEYIILKAFDVSVRDVSEIIDGHMYESIINGKDGVINLEKYYKYVLSRCKECMHIGNLDSRRFYTNSCPCGVTDCSAVYNLSDKIDDLVCMLPVFIPFVSRNKIDTVSAFEIKEHLEDEYMRLVDKVADICKWKQSKRYKSYIK